MRLYRPNLKLATPVMLVRDTNGVLVPYEKAMRQLSDEERRQNGERLLEWARQQKKKVN